MNPRAPYTPEHLKHPANQMKQRIAPGLWIDMEDHLHISLIELLDHFELEDIPENRQQVEIIIQELLAKHQPDAKIVRRETPD